MWQNGALTHLECPHPDSKYLFLWGAVRFAVGHFPSRANCPCTILTRWPLGIHAGRGSFPWGALFHSNQVNWRQLVKLCWKICASQWCMVSARFIETCLHVQKTYPSREPLSAAPLWSAGPQRKPHSLDSCKFRCWSYVVKISINLIGLYAGNFLPLLSCVRVPDSDLELFTVGEGAWSSVRLCLFATPLLVFWQGPVANVMCWVFFVTIGTFSRFRPRKRKRTYLRNCCFCVLSLVACRLNAPFTNSRFWVNPTRHPGHFVNFCFNLSAFLHVQFNTKGCEWRFWKLFDQQDKK